MWERLSSVYIVNFEQVNADLLEGTPVNFATPKNFFIDDF